MTSWMVLSSLARVPFMDVAIPLQRPCELQVFCREDSCWFSWWFGCLSLQISPHCSPSVRVSSWFMIRPLHSRKPFWGEKLNQHFVQQRQHWSSTCLSSTRSGCGLELTYSPNRFGIFSDSAAMWVEVFFFWDVPTFPPTSESEFVWQCRVATAS